MLRLRDAIELRSRHRWLGLLIAVLLALLVLLLVFQILDQHCALEDSAIICFAALLATAGLLLAQQRAAAYPRLGPPRRAPPRIVLVSLRVATAWPAGSTPLRL